MDFFSLDFVFHAPNLKVIAARKAASRPAGLLPTLSVTEARAVLLFAAKTQNSRMFLETTPAALVRFGLFRKTASMPLFLIWQATVCAIRLTISLLAMMDSIAAAQAVQAKIAEPVRCSAQTIRKHLQPR